MFVERLHGDNMRLQIGLNFGSVRYRRCHPEASLMHARRQLGFTPTGARVRSVTPD